MDAQIDQTRKTDLWGDIFDLLATSIIFLGWLQIAVLVVAGAVWSFFLVSGKAMTFTVQGYWQLIPLVIAFPFLSVFLGRRFRRHARTSVRARVGIAVFAAVYALLFVERMLQ